jgi:hypothetical protein
MKTKPKPSRRNPHAKALSAAIFRQKAKPSAKRYARKPRRQND